MSPRNDLLSIFRHAVAAVGGRRVVRDHLLTHPWEGAPLYLIAIGKAASAMALGAWDVLGGRVEQTLIVTKYGHVEPELRRALSTATVIEAGHPLPDANSVRAGQRLLELIDAAPSRAAFLFLVSGGTSALVESPPERLSLEALVQAYRWLLASGLPIDAVNRIRKLLSGIKGGRLATRLRGRTAYQLLISDVPGDDPATIGSGLLVSERQQGLTSLDGLPDWLRDMLQRSPPLPLHDDPSFQSVRTQIIAGPHQARAAAAARARDLGYTPHVHGTLITGEARDVGRRLAAWLPMSEPGIHVWSGETVVRLPEHPGRGGRCQTLALAAALGIAGRDDIALLSAGTDGGDGSGTAAGALVDGGTIGRGTRQGLDASQALMRADAGSFLDVSGDLIRTGATGTNVMDLTFAFHRVGSTH